MSNEQKTVLITGASRGLGLAMVNAFLNRQWRVIAACRHPAELHVQHEMLQLIELDLTDQAHIDRLDDLVNEPIDVLINNAGVYDNVDGGSTDLEENKKPAGVFTRLDELSRVYAVNAIAPRLVAEALMNRLQAGSGKLVVTVSSENMGRMPTANEYGSQHWPYSSSKAAANYAMATLSKCFPAVTSVLVSPGWVKTDMGGSAAELDADHVATQIVDLVEGTQLVDGTMIDSNGRSLPLG